MECFRLLLEHLAWIEHRFSSGIRDSRMAGNLWGVGGVRQSIHQSWLAKGLGLLLFWWGFKEGQKDISSEQASTFQIGSVECPPGQYTRPHLHSCHRPFEQDWHQDSSYASQLSRPCSLWLLVIPCRYETIEKEDVTKVIDTLTQEDIHGAFEKLLQRYISAGGDYFERD